MLGYVSRFNSVATALAASALLLAGCATAITGTARPDTATPAPVVQEGQLPSLLPTAAETSAIVQIPDLRIAESHPTLLALPDGFVTDPHCTAAIYPGAAQVYRNREYGPVRGQTVVPTRTGATQNQVNHDIVLFNAADSAQHLVAAAVKAWEGCANTMVITHQHLMFPNSTDEIWTVAAPGESGGVHTVFVTALGGGGFGCARALSSQANVVVDVSVCRIDDPPVLTDQAVALVNFSLAKLPV
jgi:hypothetical protein